MIRTSIYIDGFNTYYLTVGNTPYKWLDFKALFQNLLTKDHQIDAIKYFTSIVSGKLDPQKPLRQQTYIRALKAYIPEFSEYYGKFETHKKFKPLVYSTSTKKEAFIFDTKEKGSDVNLAVHLLNDGWKDQYDCAVILSNDSDLAEAIRIVKYERMKMIGLILQRTGFPSKILLPLANFVNK